MLFWACLFQEVKLYKRLQSQEFKYVLIFITVLSVRLVWLGMRGVEGNVSAGKTMPGTAPGCVVPV